MMVATHAGDLQAAAGAVTPGDHARGPARGLRTAYIPRPLEWGSERAQPGKREGDRFDVEVGSLVELAEVLG
jgi:hypothetical protein